MPSRIERWLPRLFTLALVLIIAVGAWQCRHGWPISADLMSLIPESASDATRHRAEARIQEPLTRQMVALVGAADPVKAVQAAKELGEQWTASGLFSLVQVAPNIDLPALRAQLLAGRLAMLPAVDRQLLTEQPEVFAANRARELMDPFGSAGLVPIDQDWLGLAHRTEQSLRPGGAVQFDMASGTLQAEQQGNTWVLVRAEMQGDAFDQSSAPRVAAQVAKDRARFDQQEVALLVAGGALYAAAGRAQAESEIRWIGTSATLGIAFVLLLALRRWRVLLAFVPVAVGMLTGVVACVALFGSIHALTLVIGASLIGVAIDFPMHWLGKRYGMPAWQAWPAMRRVLPGLTVSLGANLIGYLALAFTPFPALTQTAVFSAAGLLGAYACTVCLLPSWLRTWKPGVWPPLLHFAQATLGAYAWLAAQTRLRWTGAVVLALICAGGIAQLNTRDDLRQWLSLPPDLQQQAQNIGEITGFMPTSQFFLVRASSTDDMLRRQSAISARLDDLIKAGKLEAYTALSQLTAPEQEQQHLQARLAQLADRPATWKAITDMGVPVDAIVRELRALSSLPMMGLDAALAGPQGERWRALWLGQTEDGQVAGMVTLLGLKDADVLEKIANDVPGTTLVDRSGDLNRMFTATRVEAAKLKLFSYVLAALLLWFAFGRGATWRILAVPLAATACSLATLGYLGQPLTLFSLFGLLLVSAIGVDYAIVMFERVAGATASLVGIILGATTTLLSFGLLVVSHTPAISNFGLAVALGVCFSLLWAPWLGLAREAEQPPRHAARRETRALSR